MKKLLIYKNEIPISRRNAAEKKRGRNSYASNRIIFFNWRSLARTPKKIVLLPAYEPGETGKAEKTKASKCVQSYFVIKRENEFPSVFASIQHVSYTSRINVFSTFHCVFRDESADEQFSKNEKLTMNIHVYAALLPRIV